MLRVAVTYKHGDAGVFTVTNDEPNYEDVPQRFRGGLMAVISAVPREIEASYSFWETEGGHGPVVEYPSDEWWREACETLVTGVSRDYLLRVLGDSDNDSDSALV